MSAAVHTYNPSETSHDLLQYQSTVGFGDFLRCKLSGHLGNCCPVPDYHPSAKEAEYAFSEQKYIRMLLCYVIPTTYASIYGCSPTLKECQEETTSPKISALAKLLPP